MHWALELLYEAPQSREDNLDEFDGETVEPRVEISLWLCGRPLERLKCAVLALDALLRTR